ncbi:hypothetical protein SMSP2_02880 [Limihaloglobus sulfuriphilus]|uniref:Carboxypeptidase regulatory-like domain-containing protein n=1 Tax=Limihaloglobus sulfuriphilus TaxID=1851148 RepID=A0A1Q2MIK5_9BACT|nr:carboxypeptidase regulatory-like domain-containing protein [Limihaloglobus sulfuriphilus]AQQ72494.1 hypothetical protein SMSP2_02880 [Limihaloglobus sulfuriphilus]
MPKKSVLLLLLFVYFQANVPAAVYWDNDSKDQKWQTPGNWSGNAGPTAYPAVDIGEPNGPQECIIGSGIMANEPIRLSIGNNAGTEGSILIDGGDLVCNQFLNIGYNGKGICRLKSGTITTELYDVEVAGTHGGNEGVLEVLGGTITAQRFFCVAQGVDSVATINISGGLIDVLDYDFGKSSGGDLMQGTTTVNLSGGTITAGRNFYAGRGGTFTMNMTGGTVNAQTMYLGSDSSGASTTNALVICGGGVININSLQINSSAISAKLDMRGGTVIIEGDVESMINSYVSAGYIVAWDGLGDIFASYDTPIAGKTTLYADSYNPFAAYDLSPVGLETNLSAELSWQGGLEADLHHVYFSTSFDDVNNRAPAADKGYQISPYDVVVGDFEQGQIYYWCVDEVNSGTRETWPGEVVSFTTISGLIENTDYRIMLLPDMGLRLEDKESGVTADFSSEFTVIHSTFQPSLTPEYMQYASWATGQNPFSTGANYVLQANSVKVIEDTIVWSFPTHSKFVLEAWVDMSTDYNEPALFYTITASSSGWFMTAYTGAPEVNPATMELLPQPTMWGRKHIDPPDGGSVIFPDEPKSTPEHAAPMPAVAVRDNGVTCAVAVNPDFQKFWVPNYRRYEFALGIRNPEGNAQPIIFAPQMGAQYGSGNWGEGTPTDTDSYLDVGESFSFSQLWIVDGAEWKDVYRSIAENIYNVRDQRDNSGPGSMNKLLDNLRDYALVGHGTGHDINEGPNHDANGNPTYDFFDPAYKNYNMWDTEQKCNEYYIDQPAAFKILGGLFAINAAIVTDDEELFWNRALPQVEYCLSREKMGFQPYNYNYNDMMAISNNMDGPFMSGIDLGHLYWMTGARTDAFKTYSLEKGYTAAYTRFEQSLEWYRLWGDPAELDYAIDGAYYTISNPYHIYDFQKFLEIYDETADPNFLEEAEKYAYNFTTTLNTSPRVPDANIIVDINNEAPIHHHTYGRHAAWGFDPPEPMYAPEQEVPAWRPAFTGMQPMTYRAFTFSEFPGPLLRLSGNLDDDFLKSLARWGAVGRWANWPGQQFSTIDHSLVYEQDDYPMHPLQYMTFTSVHPWHHYMYFLYAIDFMVNDVITKSNGNVDFPRRNIQDKGAGGRQNLWGHDSGRFYEDQDVILWLPRNLISLNTEQINYIAGYGNGNLYLALSNQSFDPLTDVSVTLNPDRVGFSSTHTVKVWEENAPQKAKLLSEGALTVNVAASGLTVLVIENVEIKTGKVHREIFGKPKYTLTPESLSRTSEPFGKMVGMIISFGPELTEAYCYTDAKAHFHEGGDADYVVMRYSLDGGPWHKVTDEIFPFEFSTMLSPDANEFSFYFDKVDMAGNHTISEIRTLDARKITTLSGRVADIDGSGILGVEVMCSGSASVVTGSEGKYNIENVLGGPQTLMVSKAGYEFIPSQRTVDLRIGSLGNIDWVGKYGQFSTLDYIHILASDWLSVDVIDLLSIPYCLCTPVGDLNQDCRVNYLDLSHIAP